MRTTTTSLIVETTSRVSGMLEQGGVCGRVVSYPLADACKVTGMTAQALAAADEHDSAPGYVVSIADLLASKLSSKTRVIRRGQVIQ